MSEFAPSYRRHRFPPAVIVHAVWLYLRISPSVSACKERLPERGMEVSCESPRRWVGRFGPMIARDPRRRPVSSGRVWRLDEVQVSTRGRRFRLRRAVDGTGLVLEEILQPRHDRKAVLRLLRRLLKIAGRPPRRIVTDKPSSYAAAKREVAPGLEHHGQTGLNNRAENSHLPFRSRERLMRGHRSPGGPRRFITMHPAVHNRFVPPASRRRSARTIRYHRLEALDVRRRAAGLVGRTRRRAASPTPRRPPSISSRANPTAAPASRSYAAASSMPHDPPKTTTSRGTRIDQLSPAPPMGIDGFASQDRARS